MELDPKFVGKLPNLVGINNREHHEASNVYVYYTLQGSYDNVHEVHYH